MRHETNEHNVLPFSRVDHRLEFGASEGIRESLLEHRLTGDWPDSGDNRTTISFSIKEATWHPSVRYMDDWRPQAACLSQQKGRVGSGGCRVRQTDGTSNVLVLHIDQDETGVTQPGRGAIGTGKL
jgi:hypothetical protein